MHPDSMQQRLGGQHHVAVGCLAPVSCFYHKDTHVPELGLSAEVESLGLLDAVVSVTYCRRPQVLAFMPTRAYKFTFHC